MFDVEIMITTEVLGGPNQTAKLIPYETIAQATNDFDLRQKVGDGRFGPVFQVRKFKQSVEFDILQCSALAACELCLK